MSEELKPCPFCGNSDEVYGAGDRQGTYCDNCGADGPSYVSDGNPVAVWNDRRAPAEPAPASTGREVELTEALRRLCTHEKRSSEQINRDWDHARAVLAAPVAARELDVEAERRELTPFEMWDAAVAENGTIVSHGAEVLVIETPGALADVFKAICAAQSTAPVSTEQAGNAWQRVPKEPTEAMMDAAEACSDDWPRTTWKKAWSAMLAAAPSPNNSPVGADKEPK